MGLRGKTVIKLDLGKRNFEQVKQIILSNAISGSLTEKGNEDLVKAGLIKNLKKEVSSIENGLIITERESPDDKKNRPDFLAKDKDGNEVIIECKGIADAGDADQIIRYRRNYGKKVRIFLIAFEITQSCKKALKNESVEYFECDLHFKRLK
jgi:RecB family endonuclease NucS